MRISTRSRRQATFLVLMTGLFFAAMPAARGDSPIKADEEVLLFPTAASFHSDQHGWSIPIHGWIFEPERDSPARSIAIKKLSSILGLDPRQASTQLFEQRIRWFLVDNERGKVITIRLAGNEFALPESAADGHFVGTVTLAEDVVRPYVHQGCLKYEAVTRPEDPRSFIGVVRLPASEGLSVISDIDDTIKISQVRN